MARRCWGEPVLPCAICGDRGGRTTPGADRPGRISLARFGVDADGCLNCYSRLKLRAAAGTVADPRTLKLKCGRKPKARA